MLRSCNVRGCVFRWITSAGVGLLSVVVLLRSSASATHTGTGTGRDTSGERRGVGGRCHVLRLYLPCVASVFSLDKWHVLR